MRFWILLAACLPLSAQIDPATRELSRGILKQLIETNTTNSSGDNTAAARAMAQRLLDAGFAPADVTVLVPPDHPTKGNMVARFRAPGSTLQPILFIGHLNVVEALRSDWTTNPFELVEKDGYFYGRGTQDMKSQDATLVTTFIRLKREHYAPSRDLILALTSDEEGGPANGVDWLLQTHRELIDAEFTLNADAGGVMTEKGKPIDVEVAAAEKLYADFQLTATNRGGHSSLPRPENAIYELVHALDRIEHSPFPFELNAVTRAYFERRATHESAQNSRDMKAMLADPPDAAAIARLSADPLFNSLLHTTCVATRVNAGHANNALPQTAQAIVNCRILPGHPAEEVRQQLIRIVGDPQITIRYVSDSGEVSERAPDKAGAKPSIPGPEILKPMEAIADAMWPGAPVVVDMETGASDSKYTIAAGIPSFGIGELAIDHDDIRAHGKDERVRVSSFYEGVDFFYRYMKALSGSR
ncbi:MAG TPA: M20/M25/M40 family metallo-hydrolase [Bryobacteraceae bacterium]|nr:M20/M25/M40 family metallo-hydrolase [Bryobacteraceae bacterium]